MPYGYSETKAMPFPVPPPTNIVQDRTMRMKTASSPSHAKPCPIFFIGNHCKALVIKQRKRLSLRQQSIRKNPTGIGVENGSQQSLKGIIKQIYYHNMTALFLFSKIKRQLPLIAFLFRFPHQQVAHPLRSHFINGTHRQLTARNKVLRLFHNHANLL